MLFRSSGFRAALERMRFFDRVYAFVLDQQGKVMGVVSVESLVNCIDKPGKTLRDALLPGIEPIPGHTPLDDLMRAVVDSPCPLAVVNENGEYLGAITKTILLRKLCKEKR